MLQASSSSVARGVTSRKWEWVAYFFVSVIYFLPLPACACPLRCKFILVFAEGERAFFGLSALSPFCFHAFRPLPNGSARSGVPLTQHHGNAQRGDLLGMIGQQVQVQPRAPPSVHLGDSAVYIQFFCATLGFALYPRAEASSCAPESTDWQ